MPRGPKWTNNENEFLRGILEAHGDSPRVWPAEVRELVKARLAERTESGIYQQTLKIIKGRTDSQEAVTTSIYTLATGRPA
jgi:hypothetical protein